MVKLELGRKKKLKYVQILSKNIFTPNIYWPTILLFEGIRSGDFLPFSRRT